MAERTFHFELKAVDDAAGTFEGYGSVFGNVDAHKDRVMPGAFSRTLRERGAGAVKLLWQHDRTQPIGVYEEIGEDERGLRVRGRLLVNEVQKAREAYALMKAGALDGLSIGYRPLKFTKNEPLGTTDLLDVDLYEISPVTFPSNGEARITGVKGSDMPDKNEVELVEKAKLDAALAQKAEADQKIAAQAPVLATVAKLTGKSEPVEQVAELLALQERIASLPTAEEIQKRERAQILDGLVAKGIAPDRIKFLEDVADSSGDPEVQLSILRAGAAKLQPPRVFTPAISKDSPAAPAATQGEIKITRKLREEYARCGITEDALILAAERSRLAGNAAPAVDADDEEEEQAQ